MIRIGLFTIYAAISSAAVVLAASASSTSSSGFDDSVSAARRALTAGRYLRAERLLHPFALDARGAVKDRAAFGVWNQIQAMISGTPRAARFAMRAGDPFAKVSASNTV